MQQENIARLVASAPELAAAAEKVIRCWENGNLAAAVREMATVLLDIVLYESKEANDADNQPLLL